VETTENRRDPQRLSSTPGTHPHLKRLVKQKSQRGGWLFTGSGE